MLNIQRVLVSTRWSTFKFLSASIVRFAIPETCLLRNDEGARDDACITSGLGAVARIDHDGHRPLQCHKLRRPAFPKCQTLKLFEQSGVHHIS